MGNKNKKNTTKKETVNTVKTQDVGEKKPKKTMSATKKVLLGILIVFLVLLLIFAAVATYLLAFYEPDNGNDKPVFSTEGLTQETEADPPKESESVKEEETVEVPSEEDKDAMFNFLILGKDKVALNTDVIMILNFNTRSKKLSVLQIPRDTYVCINHYGYKLNSVYGHYYNEGVANNKSDPEDYGLNKLKELLEQNFCLKIHNYVLVNLEGFRNIVDILGGVEVDIPADMYYLDKNQGLEINLKKGLQVLDGKKAEMFVRYRMGYVQADLGRMDAQKIFMSALLKTVKEKTNLTTIVKIANEVFDNIKTDVSIADMVYFAKKLLSIDANNMVFMSISGYSPTPPEGYVWYYVINREGTRRIINQYFNIYEFEIADSIFDPQRMFSGEPYATYLTSYYYTDPSYVIGGDSHSAEDINQGGITIPRV